MYIFKYVTAVALVGVKSAVVKNAVLTEKLGIETLPKLIFYRNGVPILFDSLYFILLLFTSCHLLSFL